ncbi:MAG TPA: hypothetical protein VN643_25795 [Pyrinomonadaceae bacterium]|nr:hypothetical protein [Pyrinomonadaceae bacterium]
MPSTKTKFGSFIFAMCCLLVLGSAAVFAQRHFMVARVAVARPEIKVELAAAVERDNALVPVEKANVVKTDEILDWTITSENSGQAAAVDYKAVGRIPAGTSFVAGSAKVDGSAKVVYSLDGGKSFSTTPTVPEKQADGSTKQVPAPVSLYTNVRYEWADPLAPGGRVSASYKVRVK